MITGYWKPLAFLALSSLFWISACDGGGESAPVPTTLSVAGGSSQTAEVGSALAQDIQVRVVDEDGDAIQGVPVSFSVTSGGGSVSPASAQTGASGTASAAWTLGTTAGQQEARASVQGLSSVTFTATATPGSAASLALAETALTFDNVGQTADLTPVTVADEYGNVISGASVSFASQDETVATVSAGGTVTSVGEGETTIDATSGSATASASVTVTVPTFTPQNDTTVSGIISVPEVNVGAGITVVANGTLTFDVSGSFTMNGTIEGDCQAITVNAGSVTAGGAFNNACSTESATPPDLTITSAGSIDLTGARVTSDGDVTITNAPLGSSGRLRAAGFEPLVGVPVQANGEGNACTLQNFRFQPGIFTETLRIDDFDGAPGNDFNFLCDGDLTVVSATVSTQWGAPGLSQEFVNEGAYLNGSGGDGGRGGDILLVGNSVYFGDGPNSFYPGGGGDGGNWYANEENTIASGGDGGRSGVFLVEARVTGTVSSASVYPALPGDGGFGYADAPPGSDANSSGGEGGDQGYSGMPEMFDPPSAFTFPGQVNVFPQESGNGGASRSDAGDGVNGTADDPDGTAAGNAIVNPGAPGDIFVIWGGSTVGTPGMQGGIEVGGGNGPDAYGTCRWNRPQDYSFAGGSGGNIVFPDNWNPSLWPPIIVRNFGNGGDGSAANDPGAGGTPSDNPFSTVMPPPTYIGDSFLPGSPGQDCDLRLVFEVWINSDVSLHDRVLEYTEIASGDVRVTPPMGGSSTPQIWIDGEEPWIDIIGDLPVVTMTAPIYFTGTGRGNVGGYPDVSALMITGTLNLNANGEPIGFGGVVSVGTEGEFPGGNPLIVNVEGFPSSQGGMPGGRVPVPSARNKENESPGLQILAPAGSLFQETPPSDPEEPLQPEGSDATPWLPAWLNRLGEVRRYRRGYRSRSPRSPGDA